MADVSKDMGVITALAQRMTEERLPKALALKERVDKGAVLNEVDLNFLEQVVEDFEAVDHDELRFLFLDERLEAFLGLRRALGEQRVPEVAEADALVEE